MNTVLIDGDGDRWELQYDGLYRCATFDCSTPLTREDIENRFTIVSETGVTEDQPLGPRVFKPVTIPDDVTKVRNVLGNTFTRTGVANEWKSETGYFQDTASLISENPSGVTEVVETAYDRAVSYFRDNPGASATTSDIRHINALIDQVRK